MKRIGTVIVFAPEVTEAQATAALERIREVLDPNYVGDNPIPPIMSIESAKANLSKQFTRALKEGDGWFPESDGRLNHASADLVHAMHESTGAAFVGTCNPPNKDVTRVLVPYDPGVGVYGGSFVVPVDDDTLRRLMVERLQADYTGTADDAKRIDAIFARMEAVGGMQLFWT